MPIPGNITREHIMWAIRKVNREGVPPHRGARRWAVLYEGVEYPCKLLISWANIQANGNELDPDPDNFNTYDAQDYLIDRGFEIIEI